MKDLLDNMGVAENIEWAGLVFDDAFMLAVDKLAVRRFGEGALAEEAATYVVEYLSADDWGKCQAFQGKAKPKTFLYTLSGNAIEEFSRKRFGRPRPPAWLQDLGELWVKLWRSLCLERQVLPAIVDRFVSNGFRETAEVEQAARVIKARIPTCGQSSRDSVGVEDIQAVSDAAQSEAEHHCEEEALEFENPFHAELIMMIRGIVSPDVSTEHFSQTAADHCDNLAQQSQSRLQMLREAIALTDQEKVMLRMIYVDGLSKTSTSKALGLPAHQAGRLVNEVLQRIGEALVKCELDLESLLEWV